MPDLDQGMEYSFIVAGVDAGGRAGESSVPSYITIDSEYEQTVIVKEKISAKLPFKYIWMDL